MRRTNRHHSRSSHVAHHRPRRRLGRTGPGARSRRPPGHPPPAQGAAGRDARRATPRPPRRPTRPSSTRCAARRSRWCPRRPTSSTTRCRPNSSPACWARTASTAAATGRTGVDDLGQAEAAALRITCERAGLVDGQDVLELGCGWGSLSLWMADHYRNSHITAVSNSHSQRRYIEQPGRGARPGQPARGHLRRQPVRDRGRATTTASSRWRCSSTCATGRTSSRAWPAG